MISDIFNFVNHGDWVTGQKSRGLYTGFHDRNDNATGIHARDAHAKIQIASNQPAAPDKYFRSQDISKIFNPPFEAKDQSPIT